MDGTARATRSTRPITALELWVGLVCGLVAMLMWSSVHRGPATEEVAATARGVCPVAPSASDWEDDDVWDEPSDL